MFVFTNFEARICRWYFIS